MDIFVIYLSPWFWGWQGIKYLIVWNPPKHFCVSFVSNLLIYIIRISKIITY